MDLFVWQGFDFMWEALPHRVGALAAGVVEPHIGTRIAGMFPGINGDTGLVRLHTTRLHGLPSDVSVQSHVIDLAFPDAIRHGPSLAAEGQSHADLPITLADDHVAVALLQGIEWYPCRGPGEDAASREGRVDRAVPMWPTTLDLSVDLRREGARATLIGSARIRHEDAADPLKRAPRTPTWHRARLHAVVVQGPADRLRVLHRPRFIEGAHEQVPHLSRLAATSHIQPRQGTLVPGLTAISLGLSSPSGRRQGRYLQEISARMQVSHGSTPAITASGGWRGGGLAARAWRQTALEGVLLALPAAVRSQAISRQDAFRFALPGGNAGRPPPGPYIHMRHPQDRVVYTAAWDQTIG